MSRLRRDDGAAAAELALLAGVLALIVTAVFPLFALFAGHTALHRAAASGARFATKAYAAPCRAGTAGCVFTDTTPACPPVRRRPSAHEVAERVRAIAGDVVVDVTPNPCTALPGTPVRVSITATRDIGAVAHTANAFAQLLSGRALFAGSQLQMHATALGLEE